MSLEHLNWRYAVKKFDSSKKISETDFREILETLRLAPSSFGLQPWKFLVVENPQLREKLQPLCWNQPQVTQASHVIVLCSLRNMSEDYIKRYVLQVAQARGTAPEALKGYEEMMLGFIRKMSPAETTAWMKNQIYLALGMLLNECARRKIDTCPMEGFEPDMVDQLLHLPEQNLRAVVLCPVGFRAQDDAYANLKKVRFDRNQVVLTK